MPQIALHFLLASALVGCALGIITGLIPGLHVNNVAILLVTFSPALLQHGISPVCIIIIILANAVAHTFLDFIPSIFLGAPEAETALAVLPGHRLLLEGRGIEAIRLSALGSAGSVIVALGLILPLGILFKHIYPILNQYMGWILLSIALIMIGTESGERIDPWESKLKYKGYAALVFLLSGMLGIFSFTRSGLMCPIIPIGEPSILFPLLSGMFGASMLIISLVTKSTIPKQVKTKFKLSKRRVTRGIFTGSLAGSMVAWLPGVSPAVATVVTRLLVKEKGEGSSREFIVAVSGVNTANAIFGIIALYTIQRPRSGAMVAIKSVMEPNAWSISLIVLLLMVVVGVSILSYFATIFIGDRASKLLVRMNYSKLSAAILLCLGVMVVLFTGLFGFIVFAIAMVVGMLSPYLKVRRTHAMGILLLPLILYFFGLFTW
ncbi:MAG: tripartite tricarboxylate transporter permease [Methanosarcinales archaeon]|nr:MAG: tripartite tricarboxylate transporter permease [Methanosarcinales archaeon]